MMGPRQACSHRNNAAHRNPSMTSPAAAATPDHAVVFTAASSRSLTSLTAASTAPSHRRQAMPNRNPIPNAIARVANGRS